MKDWMKNCPNCGAPLTSEHKCPYCGSATPLPTIEARSIGINRTERILQASIRVPRELLASGGYVDFREILEQNSDFATKSLARQFAEELASKIEPYVRMQISYDHEHCVVRFIGSLRVVPWEE